MARMETRARLAAGALIMTAAALGCTPRGPSPEELAAQQRADQAVSRAESAARQAEDAARAAENAADKAEAIFRKGMHK